MVARLLGDAETKDLQSTEILKELTQSVALTTFIGEYKYFSCSPRGGKGRSEF